MNSYRALLPPKTSNGRLQKWDKFQLTYSFVTVANAPNYPDDHPDLIRPTPAQVKLRVREIFDMYAAIVPLTFTEIADTNDPATTANIRLMLYKDNSDSSASAYFPKDFDDSRDGDIFLYTGGGDWSRGIGSQEYATLIHEVGHALGLKHPGNYGEDETPPFLPNPLENAVNSVMSYNVDPRLLESPASQNWSVMAYDIAALQFLYGPNRDCRAGDTTYKLIATAGAHFPYAATTLQFRATQALWDAGGINRIDATGLPPEPKGYSFDLRPGGQLTSQAALNTGRYSLHAPADQNPGGDPDQEFPISKFATVIGFGVQIQDLTGTTSHDRITGNAGNNHLLGQGGDDRLEGGGGNDWLEGGEGQDLLIANRGQNRLAGGTGNDRYEIGANATGVQILDTAGVDELVLTQAPAHPSASLVPTVGLASGQLGMVRQNQDLLIDLNQDGRATPKTDLVITHFFSDGRIEVVAGRPGSEIVASF